MMFLITFWTSYKRHLARKISHLAEFFNAQDDEICLYVVFSYIIKHYMWGRQPFFLKILSGYPVSQSLRGLDRVVTSYTGKTTRGLFAIESSFLDASNLWTNHAIKPSRQVLCRPLTPPYSGTW